MNSSLSTDTAYKTRIQLFSINLMSCLFHFLLFGVQMKYVLAKKKLLKVIISIYSVHE